MFAPSQRFRDALTRWFAPGAVYAFTGAGGKTTAMKAVAAVLVQTGVRVRLTTTTRVGIDEFAGVDVSVVHGREELARALSQGTPAALIVGGTAPERGKYLGLDAALIEGLTPRSDTVLLVEGDGSRQRPMKAPRSREPVVPANTSIVFGLMGASAFDEPIDEEHCYNSRKALALVGRTGSFFEPDLIAVLAGTPEGAFKGVRSGMGFRLLINQCDMKEKRETASEALRLSRVRHGISGALVSFQAGELYETTDD